VSRETLTLYLRADCSLCEAMVEEVERCPQRERFGVVAVDIDDHPELVRRYGALIPVLAGERGEICHHFFDEDALQRYFATP